MKRKKKRNAQWADKCWIIWNQLLALVHTKATHFESKLMYLIFNQKRSPLLDVYVCTGNTYTETCNRKLNRYCCCNERLWIITFNYFNCIELNPFFFLFIHFLSIWILNGILYLLHNTLNALTFNVGALKRYLIWALMYLFGISTLSTFCSLAFFFGISVVCVCRSPDGYTQPNGWQKSNYITEKQLYFIFFFSLSSLNKHWQWMDSTTSYMTCSFC